MIFFGTQRSNEYLHCHLEPRIFTYLDWSFLQPALFSSEAQMYIEFVQTVTVSDCYPLQHKYNEPGNKAEARCRIQKSA